MGKPKIKDLSKHITGHTCSKCSTIYCVYSEELCQEMIDGFDDLTGSIIDVGKSLVRRIEQKYTEEDMINFATNMMDKMADVTGHEATKDDLKEWEDKK